MLTGRPCSDEALARHTQARIAEAQALIRQLDLRGMPQWLLRLGHGVRVFNGASLYQGPDALRGQTRQRLAAAGADRPSA